MLCASNFAKKCVHVKEAFESIIEVKLLFGNYAWYDFVANDLITCLCIIGSVLEYLFFVFGVCCVCLILL